MKLSACFRKTFAASLFLVFLAGPFVALSADEKSLEETLLRMEQLLQQQQQELEAQRQELAEQRALIRQLQTDQKKLASEPVSPPASEPGDTHTAAEKGDETDPELISEETRTVEERLADAEPGSGKEQALAELSKREQQGSTPEQPRALTLLEDPSNTTYDADFPGAWHLPGTTAAMKISGYVNLALVNSFDPMLISDRFIVGSIPAEGENVPGAKSGTDVTANQTRINYEVREETRHGTLRAFIEADFEGNGDTFRLRHAFGQYYWGLAGKTWSTLMDLESQPEEVDFEGINGMILSRQAQLRMFPNFGKSMSFKLSLEDPSTDVVNGVGARGHADVVMSVGRLPLGQIGLGDWNSRVAFIIRDLEADRANPGEGESGNADTFGWGVTTSGKKALNFWGEEDFMLWQLTYGHGVGRYLNDLATVGGGDAVFDPQGKLQPLPVFAGYASYSHGLPKDFWFLKNWPGVLRANMTFSWVSIDNYDFQDGGDYKRTLRASTNLIYLPTKNLRLGAEFLWGERKNKDNSKGSATQVQFSARYNF